MTSKNAKIRFVIDIRRESKRLARDKAARWLSGHKDGTPLANAKAERKQRRRELYQQVRIHGRNAAISRWRSLRDDALAEAVQTPAATSAAAFAVPAMRTGAAMRKDRAIASRRENLSHLGSNHLP
jgi:hypothetical protein